MLRRLFIVLVSAGLLWLGVVAPASAAPPTTTTTHEHGLVETFVDVVPTCEGGGSLYTITSTTNAVEHETVFSDGRVHATFTQTGTFVAVPQTAGEPSYTGKFTVWGGFNENGKVVVGTFTFNIRGTGSDGSTFKLNSVEHFNERPDGTVHEFFHCH
jgi:hypothetical protein